MFGKKKNKEEKEKEKENEDSEEKSESKQEEKEMEEKKEEGNGEVKKSKEMTESEKILSVKDKKIIFEKFMVNQTEEQKEESQRSRSYSAGSKYGKKSLSLRLGSKQRKAILGTFNTDDVNHSFFSFHSFLLFFFFFFLKNKNIKSDLNESSPVEIKEVNKVF